LAIACSVSRALRAGDIDRDSGAGESLAVEALALRFGGRSGHLLGHGRHNALAFLFGDPLGQAVEPLQ